MILCICEQCGKRFWRQEANLRLHTFCSRECYFASRRGKICFKVRKPRTKLKVVLCSYCGQPLKRWEYSLRRSKHHFCNKNCKGRWQSMNLIGENACNWKGGKYLQKQRILTSARYRRIRRMVMVLDKFRCQLCGSTSNLVVHHIYPKKDYPLLILDVTNLITLCRKCHQKVDKAYTQYIEFFNGIVAKRPNSVEPRATLLNRREGMVIPSQASESSDSEGVCRDYGVSPKGMI